MASSISANALVHITGDRTEATARLQRSFIDSRPDVQHDLALQYNEMSQAVADLVTSGGTKPDGKYLISLFENALPASYAQVRQMMRYQKHDDFEVYFQDILEQVKAEVKSVSQPAVGAFAARSGTQQPGQRQPSQDGQGLGANPCFNCGSLQHTYKCPEDKVKCAHCGGGHMSSLCPKGPGGALRTLSVHTPSALSRSVKSKKPAAEGNAHSVQPAAGASPSTKPSTVALQTPDEAQLIAQFRAYRAGKAAAAASSGNATASIVGAYNWLSNVSFPELSYISSQLSRFVSNLARPTTPQRSVCSST